MILVISVLILVGIGGIIFSIGYGLNKWKFTLAGIFGLVLIAGIVTLIAVSSGLAFAWFRSFANFLPTLIYGLTAILSGLGLFLAFRMKGMLRYISAPLFLILLMFSGFVLFTTNFGIIEIPDWEAHRQRSVDETSKFLDSAILFPLDASGLDFFEGSTFIEGNLNKAEKTFDFLQWILLATLAFLIVVLVVAMRED